MRSLCELTSLSLPAYHVYASPERFRSNESVTTADASVIFPCHLPSHAAGTSESAESVAVSDADSTDEVAAIGAVSAAEDADDSVS